MRFRNQAERKIRVSIHASVKDATIDGNIDRILQNVSIHASVKDATVAGFAALEQSQSFNPRVREGRDVVPTDSRADSPKFQSTRP